ncbi:MAG: 4-hydroxy-3-methylbut-2-enyl diphosphate reductase, partial [Phycisphaerae bacterium]
LVQNVAEADTLDFSPTEKGVILTQTTLSQDDTHEIVQALLKRFPHLELPPSDDICYATQNRQNAVKQITTGLDLLLVVGSQNSSNSQRLTEVARARGVQSYLVDGPDQVRLEWLEGVKNVGVTSGASAPEDVVQGVVTLLRNRGVMNLSEVDAPDENVEFKLPAFTPLTKAGKAVE